MKTYNATKRISAALKKAIINTISTNIKYSNCYFWSNVGNSSYRRRSEKYFVNQNPEYKIIIDNHIITVSPSLEISCKNHYYNLSIDVDGNKSTITKIKNLIK